ncbi:MAG: flagellar hook capping FlgD N-terminal domain-containing protein [Calditrichia bacterium]
MSNVGETTALGSLGYSSGSIAGNNVLGKEDFLKMLIAQLNNQDPLNPMEGTEFSAQLAQFSSVEQLENINASLRQSIDANYLLTTSINNTLSANIIGKDVKALGNQVYFNGSDEASFVIDLGAAAKDVVVEIRDENNNLIKKLNLDDLKEGENVVTWDGTNTEGETVGKGKYRLSVTATGTDGETISSQTYIRGQVTGVRYTAAGAVLLMGDLEIPMSEVYEILNS